MDVLGEKEITRDIVNPAITRFNAETIPALTEALNQVAAKAIAGLSLAVNGIIEAALTRIETETAEKLSLAIVKATGEVLEGPLQRVEDLVGRFDGASFQLGGKQ